LKGEFNNGAAGTTWAGFEYDYQNDIKSKSWVSLEKAPRFDVNLAWRCCPGHTIAVKKEGDLFDFWNQSVKSGMGFAGSFKDTGVQYGALWKSNMTKMVPTNSVYTLYFNHKTNQNTAGAEITYDDDTKAFKTCLGLQMKHDDHTWKFRFHNSGLMRAAL